METSSEPTTILEQQEPATNKRLSFVDLSTEQKYAMVKFSKGHNIFITGSGGTGKSKLIQCMVDYIKTEQKKVCQVCALTGCAAVLLGISALTIHSWSGIGLGKLPKEKMVYYLLKKQKYVVRWRNTDVLILDEVSMLSVHIFEMLDYVGKIIRKNSAPFGGIQLVFCGDFFQLPPIGNAENPKTSMFCFESPIWLKTFSIQNHIELKRIFRQKDAVYVDILQNIRRGVLTEENANVLASRVGAEYVEEKFNGCIPTKLFAIRSKAEHINNSHYNAIDNEEKVFTTKILTMCASYLETGAPLSLEEIQRSRHLSAEQLGFEIENLITNGARTQREIKLKIGTVVMCTVNYDLSIGICNGSQGIIVGYAKNTMSTRYDATGFEYVPLVKFSSGITIPIGESVWQSDEYPTIAVIQIPLTMAWAMTIHKIQGATLTLAEMDLGKSIFEYGQTYVALSRVQSLDGLFLTSFNGNKIKANPKVIAFYASFPVLEEEYMIREINESDMGIECSQVKINTDGDVDTDKKIIDFHKYDYVGVGDDTGKRANIKKIIF